jgi:hypothetical protein
VLPWRLEISLEVAFGVALAQLGRCLVSGASQQNKLNGRGRGATGGDKPLRLREREDDRGRTLETDVEDVNREVSRGIIRTLRCLSG